MPASTRFLLIFVAVCAFVGFFALVVGYVGVGL